jgi:hypothetical protein
MKTRYDLAAEMAREAIEELRLSAYEQGYKDATHDLTAKAPVSKSPQDIRDEIIEKAKRDIAELEAWMKHGNYRSIKTKSKYFVNSNSKVVVALVSIDAPKQFLNNGLLGKGIAKCDPSDCFNVHIGKAIALRRALGLAVPEEYLNAPQPTEVRVGDRVYGEDIVGAPYKINVHAESVSNYFNERLIFGENNVRIIDDSREEVAE